MGLITVSHKLGMDLEPMGSVVSLALRELRSLKFLFGSRAQLLVDFESTLEAQIFLEVMGSRRKFSHPCSLVCASGLCPLSKRFENPVEDAMVWTVTRSFPPATHCALSSGELFKST